MCIYVYECKCMYGVGRSHLSPRQSQTELSLMETKKLDSLLKCRALLFQKSCSSVVLMKWWLRNLAREVPLAIFWNKDFLAQNVYQVPNLMRNFYRFTFNEFCHPRAPKGQNYCLTWLRSAASLWQSHPSWSGPLPNLQVYLEYLVMMLFLTASPAFVKEQICPPRKRKSCKLFVYTYFSIQYPLIACNSC